MNSWKKCHISDTYILNMHMYIMIQGVSTASRVVMEEIFGPVLVALPFRTAKVRYVDLSWWPIPSGQPRLDILTCPGGPSLQDSQG